MNHWQFILEMQLYLMVLEKSGKYDEGISILKDDNEGIFIFEVLSCLYLGAHNFTFNHCITYDFIHGKFY